MKTPRLFFVIIFLGVITASILLLHSSALSFGLNPLRQLTVSDKNGSCGTMRLGFYGILPVGDKLYVGGYQDAENPKKETLKYSLSDGINTFYVYSSQGKTSMAKEINGKLAFGWFVRMPYNSTQRLSSGSCVLTNN